MNSWGWVFWLSANGVYLGLDMLLLQGIRRWVRPPQTAKVPQSPGHAWPRITVLVAARNEEKHLPALIDDLRRQDYPGPPLQFLIADDRSEDGTAAILAQAAAADPRFETVRIDTCPPGLSPKKHALSRAVAKATGEWIATTDADCRVASGWLRSLVADAGPEVGMRIGLSRYLTAAPPRKSQAVQDMEFLSYGIVGAGLLGLGFPVHANANNLAYRRAAYDEAGGMDAHRDIVSGDDDFLLQAIHATGRWSIEFSSDPESAVQTRPPETWQEFWQQRRRWASKCVFYGWKQKIFLSLIFAYYAAILATALASPWSTAARWAFGVGFTAKTLADGGVMWAGHRWLRAPLRLWAFFPTALLHIPLILGATLWGTFRGFVWKDGRVDARLTPTGSGLEPVASEPCPPSPQPAATRL